MTDTPIAMWSSSTSVPNPQFFLLSLSLSPISFPFLLLSSNCGLISIKQINMKGLDGIQGPIYVGTGCVFRRRALYGFDAPAKKKSPRKSCNCWPKWCCLCCGPRGEKRRKKLRQKFSSLRDSSTQVHALETFENGDQGSESS